MGIIIDHLIAYFVPPSFIAESHKRRDIWSVQNVCFGTPHNMFYEAHMTVWVELDNIIPRRYIGSGGPLFWSVKGSDLTLMNFI